MAIEMIQFAVAITATQIGPVVPNSLVQLSVPTGSGTVYVGLSNTVAQANGFAVNAGVPHTFTVPPTSQGATLWAIAVTTPSILSVLITTTA